MIKSLNMINDDAKLVTSPIVISVRNFSIIAMRDLLVFLTLGLLSD